MERKTRFRPDQDAYFLAMAHLVAERGTCVRRTVGAVITDRRNHVRATGYNGVPAGAPHCSEGAFCPGAHLESGKGLDSCYATHAEMNALLQVTDNNDLYSIYLTVSPCVSCVKVISNSSIERVVVHEKYGDFYKSERILRLAKKRIVVVEDFACELKFPKEKND